MTKATLHVVTEVSSNRSGGRVRRAIYLGPTGDSVNPQEEVRAIPKDLYSTPLRHLSETQLG